MTRDEEIEIIARELYVEFASNLGHDPDGTDPAELRSRWATWLFPDDRRAWRERAERLVASLAESRIEIVAPR